MPGFVVLWDPSRSGLQPRWFQAAKALGCLVFWDPRARAGEFCGPAERGLLSDPPLPSLWKSAFIVRLPPGPTPDEQPELMQPHHHLLVRTGADRLAGPGEKERRLVSGELIRADVLPRLGRVCGGRSRPLAGLVDDRGQNL